MNKEQNNGIDRLPRADKNIGSRNDKRGGSSRLCSNSKILKPAVISMIVLALVGTIFFKLTATRAEQSGGSPNNNPTVSRILALYNHLKDDLSFGSDVAGAWGDWGAKWNRIYSAATWTPAANSAVTDVKSSKTFYSDSRTIQTGTYPASGPCSTQQYNDDYGSQADATKIVNNCVLSWAMASPGVAGDDPGSATHNPTPGNKDPRTGLTWSQYLKNNAGTVEFALSGGSTWSWDASAAANIAVGTKTASLLCSERGNGWRLPTEKELMQAYIDGAYFNLTQPSTNLWSVTENSATTAWYVSLSSGTTSNLTKTISNQVRCVR